MIKHSSRMQIAAMEAMREIGIDISECLAIVSGIQCAVPKAD